MNNKIIVSFLLVLLLTSCRKETVPQGETGAQGNANVKTTIYSVAEGLWEQKPTSPTNSYQTSIQVNDITPDIMNFGSVALSLWTGGSSGWSPLPQSNLNYSIYFTYNLSEITVYYMYLDSSLVQNPGEKKFKVAVIAGQ